MLILIFSQCISIYIAGCMAALEAEHFLQEIGVQEGKSLL